MARSLIFVLAVAMLPALLHAARYTILGKTSDPCAHTEGLINFSGAPSDPCFSDNELPFGATTIYIPTINSLPVLDPIVAGGNSVTIQLAAGVPVTELQDGYLLCLATPGSNCDVSTLDPVIQCSTIVESAPGVFSFPLKTTGDETFTWNSRALELETIPRKLCITNAAKTQVYYTGLRVAAVFGCQTDTNCADHPVAQGITTGYIGITPLQVHEIESRTTCCPKALANGLEAGICINTNIQACCGGAAIELTIDKCCDAPTERVRFQEDPCPCFSTDTGPIGCPTTEPNCCLPTKYSELSALAAAGIEGRCFTGTDTRRCCNTGELYDAGSQQCCVINGVQTVNFPCPCQEDEHCIGGQVAPAGQNADIQTLANQRCCRQIWPTPLEEAFCNKYANWWGLTDADGNDLTNIKSGEYFPGSENLFQLQRCLGTCFDTSYQICCNGVTCIDQYEKCCNATCCNRFVGTCAEGFRPGGSDSRANYIEYQVRYEQCTTIENLGPIQAYWVYVLPTFLLIASLGTLALVVVFANNADARAYSFVERAMIAIAVLAILFGLPTFFSPGYKYGMVITIVALIVFLSASVRYRWLNIVALIGTIVLLIYIFDPFNGNDYFNLSLWRRPTGRTAYQTSGMIHFYRWMWHDAEGVALDADLQRCTYYYNYFRLDPLLQDRERFHNPAITTFGFCGRNWNLALLVFSGIEIILGLLLFVLTLMALVLRFRKLHYEPIELEVRALPDY